MEGGGKEGRKETKAIEWEEEQQVRTFPRARAVGRARAGGAQRRMIEKQASKQVSSPKLLGG